MNVSKETAIETELGDLQLIIPHVPMPIIDEETLRTGENKSESRFHLRITNVKMILGVP